MVSCKRLSYALSLFGVILLVSCGPRVRDYPSLVDAGILPLSSSNPYLGANLFLGKELERSHYLFNFFKNRGAPSAIELVDRTFEGIKLILYYPKKREVYAAELQEAKARHEWVVRGPYALKREDYHNMSKIEASLGGTPVFIIWGRRHQFSTARAPRAETLKPEIPYMAPTPKPKPSKKPAAKAAPAAPAQLQPTPLPTAVPGKPLSSDQEALLRAKEYAQRAENGDLVHVVKGDHETVEAITKWYTQSEEDISEIAKRNELEPGKPLPRGTKVRIPAGLVKEAKIMP